MNKLNNTSKSKNLYDDGNIPEIDLPKNNKSDENSKKFSETLHSHKDSPGKDDIK